MNLDAQLARIEERSRYVQISDESICDSCHARLGTKLFAMYPDDSIVCYKVCAHHFVSDLFCFLINTSEFMLNKTRQIYVY